MDFKSFRKEILSGNGSVKDLIEDFFKKIDNSNQNLNAYICTTKEKAISQADLIDKKIANKDKLPLFALSAILCFQGLTQHYKVLLHSNI